MHQPAPPLFAEFTYGKTYRRDRGHDRAEKRVIRDQRFVPDKVIDTQIDAERHHHGVEYDTQRQIHGDIPLIDMKSS